MVDLPLPGRADDADGLAAAGLEAHVAQRRPAGLGIGEAHVLEAQRAVGDGERPCARRVGDLDVEVEEAEDAAAAGGGAGEGVDQQAELAHRHLQDGHEGEEGGQRADADGAGGDLVAADQEHEPHGGEEGKRHGGGVADAEVDAAVAEGERVLRGGVELRHLVRLRGEGAHHADAAEVLLHDAGQDGEALLQVEPGGAEREVHHRGAPGDEGHEAEREQAEHEVGGDEEPGADADEHGEQHEPHDAGGEEHAHALEVEHADGDEIAGMDPVVEAEGEALDLLVEGEAELVTNVVAYGFAVVVLHHGEEAAQHADREEEERGGPERVLGGGGAGERLLALVDGAAEQPRDRELQAGGDQRGADGERRPARGGAGTCG